MSAADLAIDDDASAAVRNYAEALLAASSTGDGVDAVLDELRELVADLYEGDSRTRAVLASPMIPPAEKDRLIVAALESRALPTVVRFLRVLNRNGRLAHLPAIVGRARAIWDRRQNRVPATVTTATPLDDSQVEAVKAKVAAMTGATPILTLAVDPTLIGGLVVQVGDDVYDASIRARLRRLRTTLIQDKTREIRSRGAQLTG